MTDDEITKLKLEYNILAEMWTKQSDDYRAKMANAKIEDDMPEYAKLAHEMDVVLDGLTEKMIAIQEKILSLKPAPVSTPVKETKGKKKSKKKGEEEDEDDDVIEGEGY